MQSTEQRRVWPLVLLAACTSYADPHSLPYPANSNVSPGWEVMELIRPMRG